jgi:hypothetical protein
MSLLTWVSAMLGRIVNRWMLTAVCAVGIVLSPVLIGFAPLGSDPELMYQPIKAELARALLTGRLPFWSDRLGLGVPLIAESHVAAFYPPNWLFYRLWNVSTAYRLTLWIHALALTISTYAYARVLGIGPPGSALAAIGFALCGFQAVHAVHEPFYHLMAFLPLCLLLADRYATTGRWIWFAGLALAWGAQITLGHFQIQMWTGGLALVAGGWRAWTIGGSRARRLRRTLGLGVGLAWGAAIAWVQLRLTWELTGVSGFARPPQFLANYLLPPAHWAQFALPEVFLGGPFGLQESYWKLHETSSGEACAYVGVVSLLLAFVGAVAVPRSGGLNLWRLVVPVSLGLATMPGWWPDAFFVLLQLPGFGWFRAPARYTLLTSLGLALLAGRGLDELIAPRRFWGGLVLAILVGAGAWAWSIHWATASTFQASLGVDTLTTRFIAAGLFWALGIATIAAWRLKRIGTWAPLLVATLELGGLFYTGPSQWHWTFDLPQASPVLARLAALTDAGLIGGRTSNLPVVAGQTTAYPNLGIRPPPPNYLLESARLPPGQYKPSERRWHRRFGVTHGVWGSTDDVEGTEILAEIADPVLDRIMMGLSSSGRGGLGPWKLVREFQPFPSAWIARRIHVAESWGRLYTELSMSDMQDDAWFLEADSPGPFSDALAQVAKVKSWNGRTAIVSHDGSCILILRRTYYPGWTYRVNGGPEQPILQVAGGLQGVRLTGSGTSQVVVRYRPTGLISAGIISLAATTGAALVLIAAGLRAFREVRRTGHGSALLVGS